MRRVFVTGIGAITPYGVGAPLLRDAFATGRSGIREISAFDTSTLSVRIGGELPPVDLSEHFEAREQGYLTPLSALAVIASNEALADAGIEGPHEPDRSGVYFGTGFGSLPSAAAPFYDYFRNGPRAAHPTIIPRLMLNAPAGQIALEVGLRGPNLVMSAACSSGSFAIGQAFREVREGRADLMLAGGGESALTLEMMLLWARMRILSKRNDDPQGASRPFDRSRDGLVVSDAVVMMVLESEDSVARRGGRPRAEIAGYGVTCDASHVTAPREETEALAIEAALRDAGIDPADVDYVSAHGTATKLNDASEARAIRRVLGDQTRRVPVSSVKSMIGHSMGASGAVAVAANVFALEDQIAPPTINLDRPDDDCEFNLVARLPLRGIFRVTLVNAFGFGGANAVLVVRRP